ncbi:MAG: Asp-tRNA(Asn)/Glu-tRNA(Gln) amidotransferase subunit GatA [Planctomycetes bacterium]|nr:Asp-tRNA(Asn)/Glu-tRNA(Gln) amidotransferase subunit GatA [Planctomycetota bacterium]
MGAREIRDRVRRGELKAEEVARSLLGRIHATEPALHAYLYMDDEAVLDRARGLDLRVARGEDPGPLAGVPVAIKDNLCVRGTPTTAGSRILSAPGAGFRPPYDAGVVERLLGAGAIPLGKTNLDEFAMGSSCENSAFGPTRNPWDRTRIPGGSSGGSAAAVAARSAVVALGSDTGGSIRQPAAMCGVLGLKPTYGRVSRYGLLAFASSLDQVGPFARSAEDAALVLGAIAGHDPRDATSADVPVPDYLEAVRRGVAGLRLGVPREYFAVSVEPEVERAVRSALAVLEAAGARLQEVSLPHTPFGIPCYYIVATAEASSNLARYDGVHYGRRTPGARTLLDLYERSRSEGFGDEVKRRILLGTYVLSAGYYDAYYLRALKARTLIRRDFARAFEEVDALVAPTSPFTAFRLGDKVDDPLAMYACDVLTVTVNLAGLPGLSLPCGRDGSGLPIGLQVMGPPFEEGRLLAVAGAYQAATTHHLEAPAVGDTA